MKDKTLKFAWVKLRWCSKRDSSHADVKYGVT